MGQIPDTLAVGLVAFVDAVVYMRAAQAQYLLVKDNAALAQANDSEAIVDRMLVAIQSDVTVVPDIEFTD